MVHSVEITGSPKQASDLRLKLEKDSSHCYSSGSRFGSVLDIILTTLSKHKTGFDLSTLRLVCKNARCAVDPHVQTLQFYEESTKKTRGCGAYGLDANDSLYNNSKWPWSNIHTVRLYFDDSKFIQEQAERFVLLPLPKLENLLITCQSIMPFTQSNWPKLTSLCLYVEEPENEDIEISYPAEFDFEKKWPSLTKLEVSGDQPSKMDFLGPFIKSLPGLTCLTFSMEMTEQIATSIAETPFENLRSLDLPSYTSSEFFVKSLDRDFASLKKLDIYESNRDTVLLIATKPWIRNLESLELHNNEDLTAQDVATLLQSMPDIERLRIGHIKYPALNGFRGIKLDNLKYLAFPGVFQDEDELLAQGFDHEELEIGEDISHYINGIFSECSLRSLEEFRFESEDGTDPDTTSLGMSSWYLAPTFALRCPRLQKLSLWSLRISADVAIFLRNLRRETGCCQTFLYYCPVEWDGIFPDECSRYLTSLGIDTNYWIDFCCTSNMRSVLEECVYWGTLSYETFKYVAKAAAFKRALDTAGQTPSSMSVIHKFLILFNQESLNGHEMKAVKAELSSLGCLENCRFRYC